MPQAFAREPQADREQVISLRDKYIHAVHQATRAVLGGAPSVESVELLATIAAEHADRESADWRELPASPKDIACRPGCSACCHSPIATTVPEVIRIATRILDESGPEELARLGEKIEAHQRARSGLSGPSRNRVIHPCPLLEEGRCSVYEVRPLTCRGWSSRDVSRCESFRADPSGGAAIPIDGIQHVIANGIALGLQSGVKSLGFEYRLVELVAAIRIVLDDPGAVDRWLAGEQAFGDAELAPIDPEIDRIEADLLDRPPGRP